MPPDETLQQGLNRDHGSWIHPHPHHHPQDVAHKTRRYGKNYLIYHKIIQ